MTLVLFKLNRSRRFSRAIIEYPVNMEPFVDDSAGDLFQQIPWQLGGFGRHKIAGSHGPQSDGIIISPEIAHHAYGAHIGQRRKILIYLADKAGSRNLFSVKRIGFLDYLNFFRRDFAYDAHAQARARERLAENEVFRQSQLEPCLADFVFEEHAQRLDYILKVHMIRQAAHCDGT